MADSVLLKDLLILTKDGEWGKGEPVDDMIEMYVIRGTDFSAVRYGDLSGVPIRFIPKQIAERKRLEANDILIETAGGTREQPTGRTVFLKPRLFEQSKRPITCASFSRFLRVDTTVAVPEYIFWYLQFLYHTGEIEHHQVQHTGIARFQYTKFAQSIEIPLPSLTEQKAIAHILGTLDDKIELNREMNQTLEAIAQAIFKSWFVDFDPVRAKMEGRQPAGMDAATAELFPDEFEESALGMIPKGWCVQPLSEVVDINPRRILAKGETAPYLDMANMPTQGHRPDHWINRPFGSGTKFINGDTLLARITPCLENGKTAFVDFLENGQVGWGSTEYIIFRPKPPLPVEYGYYLARSDDLRAYTIQNMTGSSGRQRAPAECFSQYIIAIPCGTIAKRFGDSVKSTMALISSNSEQSRSLASIRDTLLPKLLSGEIRVKEAEKLLETVA